MAIPSFQLHKKQRAANGNSSYQLNQRKLTLNAPWQISLDMHKQVQNSNIDKLTKPGCINCSDNVHATFGHSSPGKWNKENKLFHCLFLDAVRYRMLCVDKPGYSYMEQAVCCCIFLDLSLRLRPLATLMGFFISSSRICRVDACWVGCISFSTRHLLSSS